MEKEASLALFEKEFKILIIENNDIFRLSLRHLLNVNFPFLNMEEAETSQNGFEKFKRFQPNLIFMDIGLPGENGLDLAEKIRALGSEIPIIFLTNYDSPEYQEAANEYGVNYFFSKTNSTANDILSSVNTIYSQQTAY